MRHPLSSTIELNSVNWRDGPRTLKATAKAQSASRSPKGHSTYQRAPLQSQYPHVLRSKYLQEYLARCSPEQRLQNTFTLPINKQSFMEDFAERYAEEYRRTLPLHPALGKYDDELKLVVSDEVSIGTGKNGHCEIHQMDALSCYMTEKALIPEPLRVKK